MRQHKIPRLNGTQATLLGFLAVILLGSGLTAQNARELLAHADGAIVGSYFKEGGNWKNAVDPQRTRAFIREVEALRREGA